MSAAHPSPTHAHEASPAGAAERVPLLLLPGTLCDARVFAPVVERLEGWPVIPGMMEGADSAAGLARLNLERAPARFALAGFSLGGVVAFEMAAQAPERVARLALLDANPRPDPPERRPSRERTVARARAEGVDFYILEPWDRLVAPCNRGCADLKETILAMARSGGAELLASQSAVAAGRADSRPRLSAFRMPVLVLSGEHEAVVPLEAQRETVAGVPGARLAVVPDAGHFAPLENPDAVAHHILAWLRA